MCDATIIDAPTSTKGSSATRRCTDKKGNEWYFGMKGHIGVDSHQDPFGGGHGGVVHDSQLLGDLLHGDETRVWGDSAYSGQRDVIAEHAPRAKDFTNERTRNRQAAHLASAGANSFN